MERELSDLPNYQLVTLALALLNGATKRVHTEEIAEQATKLSPDKFSWQLSKYRTRGWPDKYVVKTSLEDAQKAKHGRLVEGQYAVDLTRDGWRLTAAGAEWFQEVSVDLDSVGDTSREARLAPRESRRFVDRVKKELLFRLYVKEGSLKSASQYDFTDMLNTSPDADARVIATKLERLTATAHLVEDPTILEFLEACSQEYAALLGDSEQARQEDTGSS